MRLGSLLFLFLLPCGLLAAPSSVPPPDHVVPVWYRGLPVVFRSFELAPGVGYMREEDVPVETRWNQTISYIVGVVDTAIGESPYRRIHLPGGREVVMPGHQAVITCLGTPGAPLLGVAYSVVPAPQASALDVRSDPMPEDSVIGAPLATAIRLGPAWVNLDNHVAVELGLRLGLLKLAFFGANPVGWATPDWRHGYPPLDLDNDECPELSRASPGHLLDAQLPKIPAH